MAHRMSGYSVRSRAGRPRWGSDVDLLVDLQSGRTLIDQIGLWRDLEALLGVRVDVVSAGGLTERDDDIRDDAPAL